MDATLTLSGSFDEILAVAKMLSGEVENATEPKPAIDIVKFLSLLSDDGRRAVGSLALHSRAGYPIPRDQWQEDAVVEKADVFNGVLGSIGRAWAKVSSDPNPFLSRGQNSNKEHVHQITDRELAIQIDERIHEWLDTSVQLPSSGRG